MREATSLLISESSEIYCELLKKAFHSVKQRFNVVAAACSAEEVLSKLQELNQDKDAIPQVALISANLSEGPLTGIRILPAVRKINPGIRTLIAMDSQDRESVIEAFKFGADGVFCRNTSFNELCKSLEAVSQGQVWANSAELRYVLDALANSSSSSIKPRKVDPIVEGRMTKREGDVVRLAVEGLSNREIAKELGLTENTVKNYLFRVFDKLGVSNRVELVLSCLRQEDSANAKTNAIT